MTPSAPAVPGSLSIDEIIADARRSLAENPPPPLDDATLVKLRTLFEPPPLRTAA